MSNALLVASPSDLGAEGRIVLEGRSQLNLQASAGYGFDFHWLREVTGNILTGDFGLDLTAAAKADLKLCLKDEFRREISLDEDGWLRLQVFRLSGHDLGLGAGITASVQARVPLPEDCDSLLAALLGTPQAQKLLGPALRCYEDFQRLPAEIRQPLAELLSIYSAHDMADVGKKIESVLKLRDRVYSKALEAVRQKFVARIGCLYQASEQSAALLDCSFKFTPAGLAAYREALQGDYARLLTEENANVRLRQGRLTHGLSREIRLEVHLPFMSRAQWRSRLESFASMEVEVGEDGRVMVYDVEAAHRVAARDAYQSALALAGGVWVKSGESETRFTLTYTDQHVLKPQTAPLSLAPLLSAYGFGGDAQACLEQLALRPQEGDLEASLTVEIPGKLVSAWLKTPPERSTEFYRGFSSVSRAVQQAMRTWLPYAYFSQPERYEDLGSAFPLLVYQASGPFVGKTGVELSYDVMSSKSMEVAYRTAAQNLPGLVQRAEQTLRAAGKNRSAEFYAPRQAQRILASVQRDNRLLRSLLSADTFFIHELVRLGNTGRQLSQQLDKNPQEAVKNLSKFAAQFVKAFHGKLRRLYGGQGFTALSSLFLIEATRALGAAYVEPVPIAAKLHLKRQGSQPLDRFFTSPSALP